MASEQTKTVNSQLLKQDLQIKPMLPKGLLGEHLPTTEFAIFAAEEGGAARRCEYRGPEVVRRKGLHKHRLNIGEKHGCSTTVLLKDVEAHDA